MSRLTDDDMTFGPLTVGRSSWNPLRLVFSTGGGVDDHPANHLTAYAFGWVARLNLPTRIKPWRRWVDTSRYEWSMSPAGGYWDVHAREYGFSLHDGFLQVFLGPQTGDSDTEKNWCKHLPWQDWRHVRQSWYGPTGQHIETLWDTDSREVRAAQWEWRREFEQTLVKTRFLFTDFDGEQIEVATHIEEREWRFGTGWFKWLSLFRRRRIKRYLDLEFSKETGRRKGSWKGGTVGHSIEMLPGELHEAAFRRYCDENEMTFVAAL